ncbi:type I glutamate--ammonia ligase [Desulfococcaceae bacterium OttesenSCG-928-F15]|nr:type I glutamate--ammonia ligase [Desulfococcaceae bacterium OttesenSCG-928-F15]
MNPKEVLEFAVANKIRIVDMRFMDFIGTWQHCSYPLGELGESTFEDGFGFDGSSIRGWRSIDASDMLLIPDARTAKLDPFAKYPTLVLIADIVDPITRTPYSRDPRFIARKAEAYLKSTGIGDTCFIGPEPEFFIFDDIRYESGQRLSFYEIDSREASWNTGKDEDPNLGYKARPKEGYFPVPPLDKFQDLRSEMLLTLEALGIHMECHHHEACASGQCEIDMRFKPLLEMADQMAWLKYVLKNVAYRNGHTLTFMPKPIFGDAGSGMHTHASIWKNGKPLFAGNLYAGLSQEALWAIGGIMKHAKALCAFTNPTTNSYKRLVPGFEAPINIAYSGMNRSAAIRIPVGVDSPKAKRVEFRTPDPSCNAYLAFSAILMAMIDGIQNKLDPGDPMDKNIYDLPPEELANIPSAPGSLEEALKSLTEDHAFLMKGDVFTEDVIRMWVSYKTEKEVSEIRTRPHPHEFFLYYDT